MRRKKKSEMDVAGWARVDYVCLYLEHSAKTIPQDKTYVSAKGS